ncbi:MAG: hypothetical protein ACYC1C_21410 [Chloroflexota bacterium]
MREYWAAFFELYLMWRDCLTARKAGQPCHVHHGVRLPIAGYRGLY